jgi:hypothetical protein
MMQSMHESPCFKPLSQHGCQRDVPSFPRIKSQLIDEAPENDMKRQRGRENILAKFVLPLDSRNEKYLLLSKWLHPAMRH